MRLAHANVYAYHSKTLLRERFHFEKTWFDVVVSRQRWVDSYDDDLFLAVFQSASQSHALSHMESV